MTTKPLGGCPIYFLLSNTLFLRKQNGSGLQLSKGVQYLILLWVRNGTSINCVLTSAIHFGSVQIIWEISKSIELVLKSLICSWQKWFGPDQFGRSKIKGITALRATPKKLSIPPNKLPYSDSRRQFRGWWSRWLEWCGRWGMVVIFFFNINA